MELLVKITPPEFTKTASKLALSDNPATYASELTAHLYKQHPYLGKYEVNLSIEGSDESKGYMYGLFTVSPASQVPPEETQRRMDMVSRPMDQPPSPEETLRIPIIVDNKKAYSFDVFISPDGKFYPLSEERIASALFSASPYIVAPVGALRDAQGFSAARNFSPDMPTGASGTGPRFGPPNSSVEKVGSVLNRVSGLVDTQQANELLEKVANSQWLTNVFRSNPAFQLACVKVSQFKKEASAQEPDTFDTAVIQKAPGGYHVTSASAQGFKEKVAFISNVDAEHLPLHIRQEVASTGYALLSDNEEALDTVNLPTQLEKVASTGVYAVLPNNGPAERAVVLKDVITFDGAKTKLAYIVGASGASFQGEVAGIRCGDVDLDSIQGSYPRGEGMLLFPKTAQVSEPITIKQSIRYEDGQTAYVANRSFGDNILIKTAAVRTPVKTSQSEYLIPQDSRFIPLSYGEGHRSDTASIASLTSQGDLMNKVAVISDGTNYEFSGRPVDSLGLDAVDYKTGLLVLSAMGDSPAGAKRKLAAARTGKKVEVVAKNALTVSAPGGNVVEPEVSELINSMRVDLTKEASVLTGPDTVDSVLSLNFITPENIQGYIDSLPEFEQASSKLAELLVGVRLGLTDIPEAAVSSAMKGIERAITGLKKLQLRLNFAGA